MGYRAWKGPAGSLTKLVGYRGASRITGLHGPAYVNLPGDEYATTPYAADLEVTDDFEMRAHIRLASYSTLAARSYLVGNAKTTTTYEGWMVNIETNGALRLLSRAGDADTLNISSASLSTVGTDGEWLHVKVTRVGTLLRYWTSADGDSWTQLGNDRTLSGSITPRTTTGLAVGAVNSSGALATRGGVVFDIARVRVWKGGVEGVGTAVHDFNAARAVSGQPPGFLAATGETWSFTGATYEVFGGLTHEPTTLYLAPTGSDSTGDGSIGNPFLSLVKVAPLLHPGDTVLMRNGYYDAQNVNTNITVEFSGTEASPITVKSYPTEWAIIDSIDHPWHPRSLADGRDETSERALRWTGKWVTWENFEIRNAPGTGMVAICTDTTFRGVVFRNNHGPGLWVTSARTLFEECLFQDNYSISTAGESANGFFLFNSSQLPAAFPGESAEYNTIRRCISRGNSDDGYGYGTARFGVAEYSLAISNGRDTDGDGNGFKVGLSSLNDRSNTARYCIAYENRDGGFDTNTAQGVTFHNNTAIRATSAGIGFLLAHSTQNANFAYNNIAYGFSTSRGAGDNTVHTHNNGWENNWGNGTNGSDNMNLDPAFVSVDPTNVNFLKLTEGSAMRAAGTVVHQASDTDLGAIPYNTEFAGGWDWRALLAAHPQVETWPMPQPE